MHKSFGKNPNIFKILQPQQPNFSVESKVAKLNMQVERIGPFIIFCTAHLAECMNLKNNTHILLHSSRDNILVQFSVQVVI